MQIIEASTHHIPIIQQIANVTWHNTYTFLNQEQLQYMLNWMYSTISLQQQFDNNHKFYLAQNDNQSIGFASINKMNSEVCKLNKLYVLPQTQKTGAGKLLLQKTIDYTKEKKCNKLQLQVNRNNAAKDFYSKHGFIILYEKDFDIGNGYFMNDYVMELNI